jgi:hypothetical protein
LLLVDDYLLAGLPALSQEKKLTDDTRQGLFMQLHEEGRQDCFEMKYFSQTNVSTGNAASKE